MIVDLARQAPQVDVALLLDPDRGQLRDPDSPPDDLSLFARTERTWFTIVRALNEAGVPVETPILLGRSGCPRFARSPTLARLERDLFSAPRPGKTPEEKPAPTESGRPAVRFVRAPDRRAEVDAAVTAIVDLVQHPHAPLRYRDVSIVVRDLEPYHEIISASLHAHGIPFFVDRRRPTHHHALIQFSRAALSMQGREPFSQAIAAMLKSGLSGLDDEAADALENYLLAYGLNSPESWDEPWTYPVVPEKSGHRLQRPKAKGKNTDSQQSPERRQPTAPIPLDSLRQRLCEQIGEWWPTATAKQAHPVCRTWVRRLYGLLERFGVSNRLASWCDDATARGELDEAEEHEQIWSDLIKLMDEMVETLGDEPMTGRQFRDVLESGLSEFTLGLVPATLDQVLVSSIERSRHPPVRAVFLLGFNDGLFPARPSEDSILGDEERSRLERAGIELGRSRVGRLLDERMLAYVALTRPSEFLWISYSESDESGKALPPSPFWAYVQSALPAVSLEAPATDTIEAISSPRHLAASLASHVRAWCELRPETSEREQQAQSTGLAPWLALYNWALAATPVAPAVRAALRALAPSQRAALTPRAAASLWPPPCRTSVTRLESFAACPFQHFATYGLRLEPRPVHEIAALDLGRLYHFILEQFVNELMETGSTLSEMPPERIAENLSRLCRTVVPQFAEAIRLEQRGQRNAVRRGERELPPAVRGEPSATGKTPLRPLATEKTFGDAPDDDLPALELPISGGRTVLVRGVIDRVDMVQVGDASLAVVFDYKRSLRQRLRLDEVFHGLSLQLLAYLLVIRDHGQQLADAALTPGGAFYLPLLASFNKVDHPDEADEAGFDPYKEFRPRGVIDFDWINALDPTLSSGHSSTFAAFRTTKGEIGNVDSTDAVGSGALPRLLDHVRRKMTDLAEDWLSGNISVTPYRLGKETPCPTCRYAGVCRIEYATRECRVLRTMKRTAVLEELAHSPDPDQSPSGSEGHPLPAVPKAPPRSAGHFRKEDTHG